jgi:hypothetical protein
MKRTLIHALCLGIVAVGGTRLAAQESGSESEIGVGTNYDTCLDYCIGEGNPVVYCLDACKEHS